MGMWAELCSTDRLSQPVTMSEQAPEDISELSGNLAKMSKSGDISDLSGNLTKMFKSEDISDLSGNLAKMYIFLIEVKHITLQSLNYSKIFFISGSVLLF